MPTFDVKTWRKTRPESAKGKGVAEAIGEVNKKALAKAPSAMSGDEVKAAKKAIGDLKMTLGNARNAIESDKKNKDRTAVMKLIEKWNGECNALLKTIEESAGYQVRVATVQEFFNERYNAVKQDVDTQHAAAQLHNHNATQPSDKQLQDYLTAVRDGAKICSKSSLKDVGITEAKTVKESDIVMPDTIKATKAKVAQLMTWCDAFVKQGRANAKGAAANLDDNVAVEKAVKKVMEGYKGIESQMKVIINAAKAAALQAKQLADRIKNEIGSGNTDSTTFNTIAKAVKATAKLLNDADADMKQLGEEWRTKDSRVGKLVAATRLVNGYSEPVHGKIMTDRMQANQMLIRQVSLPVAEGLRQVERAKRLLQDSTNHRGYASAI